jgi:hypothetical protein
MCVRMPEASSTGAVPDAHHRAHLTMSAQQAEVRESLPDERAAPAFHL